MATLPDFDAELAPVVPTELRTTPSSRWLPVAWVAAYGLLTAALSLLGVVVTVSLMTLVSSGIATVLVIFTVGIGSLAASPTIARLILVPVKRRLDRATMATDPDVPAPIPEELRP